MYIMRKFSVIAVIFSLAAGAGGFILRRYQLADAFDTESGLVERGAESTFFLHILIAAFIAAVIAVAIFSAVRYRPHESFEDTFGTYSVLYPLVFIPVCAVWCCGTVIHYINSTSSGNVLPADIYFAILSLLAAVCVLFFAIGIFQNPRHKAPYILSIAPIVFLCFWLILHYRDNATNPVLESYVYQCLAIVSSALSFYYIAGIHYGKPSVGKAIFSYALTVLFCGITLADDIGIGLLLVFGALLAIGTVHLFLLLRSLVKKH